MADPVEIAKKLSEAQRRLLREMSGHADTDTPYRSFKDHAHHAGMDVGEVAAALRDARAKGLAQFESGLMTDEGEPYGSGYCLTPLGLAVRQHLQEQQP